MGGDSDTLDVNSHEGAVLLAACSGQSIHVLIPETEEYVISYDKGKISVQMKIILLTSWSIHRKIILHYSGGSNVIKLVLINEREGQESQSGIIHGKKQMPHPLLVLKMKWRHQPRNEGSTRKLRKPRKWILSYSLEKGTHLYWHPDFSQVRNKSYFWSTKQ